MSWAACSEENKHKSSASQTLWEGISPEIGKFLSQSVSNAEKVHYVIMWEKSLPGNGALLFIGNPGFDLTVRISHQLITCQIHIPNYSNFKPCILNKDVIFNAYFGILHILNIPFPYNDFDISLIWLDLPLVIYSRHPDPIELWDIRDTVRYHLRGTGAWIFLLLVLPECHRYHLVVHYRHLGCHAGWTSNPTCGCAHAKLPRHDWQRRGCSKG